MVKAITPRWDAINSIEINAIPLKTTKNTIMKDPKRTNENTTITTDKEL